MHRFVALLALLVLAALALAPSAQSAGSSYRPGTYSGKTSQGNPVRFSVARGTCNTGKVVGGTNQLGRGTCVTLLGETPHISGACTNGAPAQFGSVGGTYLIPKSGTLRLTRIIGSYDLRISLTLTRDGRAHGTGHFHEEYQYAPSPTAAAVTVVCESGAVTFKARRSGR